MKNTINFVFRLSWQKKVFHFRKLTLLPLQKLKKKFQLVFPQTNVLLEINTNLNYKLKKFSSVKGPQQSTMSSIFTF